MKTNFVLTAAVLASFTAPARAEMSGVPYEMQFWLLQLGAVQLATPAVQLDASWANRRFDWRGEVVHYVPSAIHVENSGVPKELQFWLLKRTIAPAAEASVGQSRTTTEESRTTTGEGEGIPYPPPRPKS